MNWKLRNTFLWLKIKKMLSILFKLDIQASLWSYDSLERGDIIMLIVIAGGEVSQLDGGMGGGEWEIKVGAPILFP